MAKIEGLLSMAQEQDKKIENGLKFIVRLPKSKQLEELNAIELEAKEFQKLILRIQKLKGGLKRRTPDHARLLNDVELIEDKEVDLHLKFQKIRKKILGLGDSAVGGGGNSKGVMMAAALGMKIGEQGIKRTEEILATLREANDLMDNMQGDILEQRKKLFRIQDQVKQAQSLTNRGKEVMKYFAGQASKDLCIKILVGLIAVMIVAMLGLTYQISQERDMIQESPDEMAEKNLEKMGLEIDEKGRVMINPEAEAANGDGIYDKENPEIAKKNQKIKENYLKEKELAKKKNNNDDREQEDAEEEGEGKENAVEEVETDKEEDEQDRRLDRILKERMLKRNREVLTKLHVG